MCAEIFPLMFMGKHGKVAMWRGFIDIQYSTSVQEMLRTHRSKKENECQTIIADLNAKILQTKSKMLI